MTPNFKKLLLASTALLAVGFAQPAFAVPTVNFDSTNDGDPGGSVDLDSGADINITGDGTNDYTANIANSANGANAINVTLDAAGNTITVGGTVTGVETITLVEGQTTFGGAVSGNITVDVQDGADLITSTTFGADTITVAGDATFTSGGDVTVLTGITLSGTGGADITGDTVNGNIDFNGGTLTTGGTASLNGNLDIDTSSVGGSTTVSGNLNFIGDNRTLTFSGDGSGTTNFGGIVLSGGAGANGTLNYSNSAGDVSTSSAVNGFETINVNGGGEASISGIVSDVVTATVSNDSTLDVDSSTFTATTVNVAANGGGNNVLDIAGATNWNVGTTNINGGDFTTAGTATINGDLNITTGGTISGDILLGNGDHDLTFLGNSATITNNIDGNAAGANDIIVNMTGGQVLSYATGTIGANIDSIQLQSGEFSLGASTLTTGITMTAGTEFSQTAGSYGGTVTGSTGTDSIDIDGGTVAAAAVYNLGQGTDTVNIADGVTVTAGSSFNLGADGDADVDTAVIGNVDFAGDFVSGGGVDVIDLNGTTISTANFSTGAGADTVTMNGVTITGTFDGGAGADEITIDGGTVAVNGTGALTNVSDVNIDNGTTFTYNSSTAFAGTITAGTAGVQTLNTGAAAGTLSGDITLGDGADVVDINGGTFSGAVNTGTGDDVITLAGATFTGGFDGGDAAETVLVDSGVVSFDSAVTNVATIQVDNGATVAFGANSAFSGTITEQAAGENQTVVFDAPTTGLTGATIAFGTGTDALNVTATGAVSLGTVTGAATTDFGANAVVTLTEDIAVGDITFNNATNAFATTLDANGNVDTITTSGTITVNGASSIDLTVADTSVIKLGQSYTIVTDTGLGSSLSGVFSLADDTLGQFIQFTEDTTTNDVYAVVAESTSAATFNNATTVEGSKKNLIAAADAVISTPVDTAELDALQTALLATTTPEAAEAILDDIMPTVDAGSIIAGINVNAETNNIIDDRLASLRQGNDTGMSAGSYAEGLKVWAQAFGQYAEQDDREGIKGYEATTFGGTVGIDTQSIADNLVVGLALSYGNTDVDSNNANNTDTDIDSYQAALYGEYALDNGYFVEGNVSYAYNDIEQTRKNVGVSNLTATADYESNQYGAGLALGRDIEVNYPGVNTSFVVTPKVSADFLHIDTDEYSEKGAGGLALQNVDTDDFQVLDLGVSVDATWTVAMENGSFVKPSLHAGYAYDAINDEVETTSQLSLAGPAFKTEGFDPDEHKFNIGAGIAYEAANNWELNAEYDFEVKEDYDAHSGVVRASYKF